MQGNARLCLATCSVHAGVDSREESGVKSGYSNIRKETHEEYALGVVRAGCVKRC